jgi:hydrogenase maturation protease
VAVRVIGLGQRAAGDDGVGLAVLDALESSPPPGAELHRVSDPTRLIDLLQSAEPVVVVDAALGAGPPGSVRTLTLAELSESPLSPVSTHGISVGQAIELAKVLGNGALPPIYIVAIAIEEPTRYCTSLSAPVAGAVPLVINTIRDLVAK